MAHARGRPALSRPSRPTEAKAELDAAGVGSAILVQAEDSLRRHRSYLLGVAAENAVGRRRGRLGAARRPGGGRGRPRSAGARIPAFCGVRHLVHDDPRHDFLDLPAVRDSLALGRRARPRVRCSGCVARATSGRPTEVAAALPAAHRRDRPSGEAAASARERVRGLACDRSRSGAALPNMVAKFSGLTIPGAPFTAGALRPASRCGARRLRPDRADVRRRLADDGAVRRLPARRGRCTPSSSASLSPTGAGAGAARRGRENVSDSRDPISNRDL